MQDERTLHRKEESEEEREKIEDRRRQDRKEEMTMVNDTYNISMVNYTDQKLHLFW